MKLYLISQDINGDYDTYDSAVVAAETEEAARSTPPDGETGMNEDEWVSLPDLVECKYIGEAKPGMEAGVVCASYNAG